MLFDSHTHLDDEQFDADRLETIERAKAAGVQYIMNPGSDLASSVRAVELAENYPFVYAAVGVHPHDVVGMDEQMLAMIEHLAGKEKVKAIGEIGLDYYRDLSPRNLQQKWFIEQIRLAKRLKLPVIIHDRDANGDVFSILKQENAFETGVVMHLYSGSKELAEQYVKLGAMISIGGTVTFKNARKTVEVAESVPIEHLLIETDAPYIAPEPMRGRRNEPSFVRYTCERIAAIRGASAEEIAEETLANAKRIFNIR
jgi:TatD DNase family protein